MKKKIIIALFLVVMVIHSATIGSLLSWSNVPEPAKSVLGWAGIIGVMLYFPVLILLVSDEAG